MTTEELNALIAQAEGGDVAAMNQLTHIYGEEDGFINHEQASKWFLELIKRDCDPNSGVYENTGNNKGLYEKIKNTILNSKTEEEMMSSLSRGSSGGSLLGGAMSFTSSKAKSYINQAEDAIQRNITYKEEQRRIAEEAVRIVKAIENGTLHNILKPSGHYEIQQGVKSIGAGAFRECSGLTSVTIPDSVTSIGAGAFRGCSGLTSVTIPNSVTSIGESAFNHCKSLTSITIPNSVTSIGKYAFFYCSSLTSISIPNSVTSIGEWAFVCVNNIIYFGTATGSPWGAKSVNGYVDGCLVYSDATKTNLLGCSNAATGEIVIPNSVISIGYDAFYDCIGLTSVTIPKSVKSIGDYAFLGCSGLTSVTIPKSVKSIGDGAFRDCSSLTSVTIPNSVTSIGGSAFSGCIGLTSVTIPKSVKSIGKEAFCRCSSLTSIEIPNSVTSIGNYTFRGCTGLKKIIVPKGRKQHFIFMRLAYGLDDMAGKIIGK